MLQIDRDIFYLLESFRQNGRLHTYSDPTDASVVINAGCYLDGQQMFRFTLKEGKLHGKGRLWYENGQPMREESFHHGRRHGIQRLWYRNSQMKSETFFLNGQYEGRKREWYANSQMKSEYFYKWNILEGPMTEWYSSGLIREQGYYREGLRHGIWKEFDEDGKIHGKEMFIRGVRMEGYIHRLLNSRRLSARHILRIKNASVRRLFLEELGYERFLAGMEHEILHSDGEYQLVKINWHPQEEPIYLVKVQCPSTTAFYTLRVPPHVKTVREAVAWTFGLSENQYLPQEET